MPSTPDRPSDLLERGRADASEAGYLLNDEDALLQLADEAIAHAQLRGAHQVSATAAESAGILMKVRDGVAETRTRDGSVSLSISVFEGGRTGVASTSALTAQAIRTTVERAIDIAREVQADPDGGPAEPQWLAPAGNDVDLYAPSGLSARQLSASAEAIEEAALSSAGRSRYAVRVLESAAASHERRWALAIGTAFRRAASASMHSRWCRVIADHDGIMAGDHWSETDRRMSHLPSPALIGERAVARAIRKLGARTLSSRSAAVLLDSTIAASLVQELASSLMGSAQHTKATFLAGALGSQALAEHLDLIEDPFEPYGLASGAFDGEGVGGARRHVVAGGVIEGYFLSSKSARRLGMKSTGNASGTRNLTLTSRTGDTGSDLAEMLRRLDRGLWVTELLGGGVNPVTGAYSKAVAGFWIESGDVQFPVQDITIAGDLPTMLRNIVAVGDDAHRSSSIRTGSVLLDAMQIAGR